MSCGICPQFLVDMDFLQAIYFTLAEFSDKTFSPHVPSVRCFQGRCSLCPRLKQTIAMAQNASQGLSDALPGSLIDSYIQYKSDTDYFTTWLAHVGQRCGYHLFGSYEALSQSVDRSAEKKTIKLKGKARKLAKDAGSIDLGSAQPQPSQKPIPKTLRLRDFIPLATHIASFTKPPVSVPRPVVKKLRRAINLRHRCAAWFKARPDGTTSLATNECHQYFIEVLETVLTVLMPLCNQDRGLAQAKDDIGGVSRHMTDIDPHVMLQNRFASLAVQEADDEEEEKDLDILAEHTSPVKASKTSSFKPSTFVPEYQSPTDNFMLGCFCLFQDLQDVRLYLQRLWQRFKEKRVALIVASLVTNTALDFVRRAEENFKTTFSQSGDYYDCFIDKMFRQACAIRGYPLPAAIVSNELDCTLIEAQLFADDMTEEGEWIMLPAWYTLKNTARLVVQGERCWFPRRNADRGAQYAKYVARI
jgi:hypothetical protein